MTVTRNRDRPSADSGSDAPVCPRAAQPSDKRTDPIAAPAPIAAPQHQELIHLFTCAKWPDYCDFCFFVSSMKVVLHAKVIYIT